MGLELTGPVVGLEWWDWSGGTGTHRSGGGRGGGFGVVGLELTGPVVGLEWWDWSGGTGTHRSGGGWHGRVRRRRGDVAVQVRPDGRHQRVFGAEAAEVVEVVRLHRPDHAARQTQ